MDVVSSFFSGREIRERIRSVSSSLLSCVYIFLLSLWFDRRPVVDHSCVGLRGEIKCSMQKKEEKHKLCRSHRFLLCAVGRSGVSCLSGGHFTPFWRTTASSTPTFSRGGARKRLLFLLPQTSPLFCTWYELVEPCRRKCLFAGARAKNKKKSHSRNKKKARGGKQSRHTKPRAHLSYIQYVHTRQRMQLKLKSPNEKA